MTHDPTATTPVSTWSRRTWWRQRWLFGGALAATLLIAAVGVWSLRAVRTTLEASVRSELETSLKANVTALELWIQSQIRTANLIASDRGVREPAVAALLQAITNPPAQPGPGPGPGPGLRPDGGGGFGPGGGRGPGGPFGTNSRNPALTRALEDRLQTAGYTGAVLVGTNGRVVLSFGPMRIRPGAAISADHSDRYQKVLQSGEPALITPFKPARPGRRFGPGGPGGTNGPGGFRGGFRGGPGGGEPPGAPPNSGGTPPPQPPGSPGSGGPGGPGGRGDLQVMQVLTPVRDNEGTVMGVLALVLRPEAEFTRVLSVARTGHSGETFAFGPEGRLMSQSRFEEQLRTAGLLTNSPNVSSALNLVLLDPGADLSRTALKEPLPTNGPLMGLVAKAINEPPGVDLEPTRDYRGIPVVGAWQWVDEHHFGVVTKIDAEEAFRPLRVLRGIFQILFLLVVLATVAGLMASLAGSIWRRRFTEAVLRARQLGQYTLIEQIGAGAMGVVYRGRHALLRRETAIKLLLPDRADEGLIRQFEHEVQLTCRLTHPNTIQVFDYGHTADGIFYYAMELLEGLTWEELVERHGAVPQERLIHLLRQAAGSLQEAHAAGLIHRDIKPGNLFLCERGGIPDTVKVLDFGLVREASSPAGEDSRSAQAARFLGTPLYMAPETIRTPGHGDIATDLYALGAVAYQLLTGRPVFVAETVEKTWDLHLTAEPVPPTVRIPDVCSPELESLILDCLAKDPARRPASMGNFLARLEACPLETAWDPERRRDWWRRFGKDGSRRPGRETRDVGATIRIDLEER